jgi:hypothetical protein
MTEPDPLPDELKRLFDAERAAPGAHSSARAAIRATLTTTIGKATLGHAAVGAGIGIIGKTIVGLAVVIGVAGGTAAWIAHRHASAQSAVFAPPARTVEHVAAAAVGPPPAIVEPAASPPIVVHAPAPARSVTPNEPELLRRAWAASTTDPSHSLALIEADEHAHPRGALAEERAALRVVVLANLGRLDDAKIAAAAFDARYPNSVHHTLVLGALGAK